MAERNIFAHLRTGKTKHSGASDDSGVSDHSGAPTQTQRSGLRGERRDSGMSEPCGEARSEECGASGGEGYTPASFEKRAAAWMGIVYVLMLLFILNFTLFTGGRELPGTFPLFLVPVCVTLAIVVGRRLKSGLLPGGKAAGIAVLAGCAAGALLGLALGVPPLLAALGV